MREFYQIHEVRKILSRLIPYTKAGAKRPGKNGGRVLQAGEQHAQRHRAQWFEKPKDGQRGHHGGRKGKPDKRDEMGHNAIPGSLRPSG